MTRPDRSRRATPALAAVLAAGVPHEVLTYTVTEVHPGQGYGLAVARALGIDPAQMFKTLMVQGPEGQIGTAVIPVECSLELKSAAVAFGWKRSVLATPEVAERRSGSVVGGISPLGHRRPSPVALDRSAQDLEELGASIIVSAGQRGLSLRLSPADLVRLTDAMVVPLTVPV
ncbi:aminoacyl-tRNA deacylase [Micrococcus terreus]|uniref:Cys-tRNA(Pro)/Cys-tRNA(Cys) deacylase n=1 Tax=Micrococcus terreus TaxID=574650 RepID=A0A1I7MFU5_9MICC|nr:aminoacyl-tRNA deacylase [Micrococcus terreus]SFV20802.1 Cys-tRNA(Pro)/Cys-tRNA(Cys) deacylase [Micrococcus terreus]